jgi:AcrR family transcriptional regulator
MSRVRQFDTEKALDAMVGVFWRKGFVSTSIRDLEDATNLTRPSLYAAFGGKNALFLEILTHYQERYNGHLMEALRQPGSSREALRTYFEKLSRQLSDRRLPPGCLLTNSVIEFGAVGEATGRFVREQLTIIESEIYRTLRRGQIEGEISANLDPKAVARLYTATAEGMALLARAGFGEEALKDIVDSAMRTLESDSVGETSSERSVATERERPSAQGVIRA